MVSTVIFCGHPSSQRQPNEVRRRYSLASRSCLCHERLHGCCGWGIDPQGVHRRSQLNAAPKLRLLAATLGHRQFFDYRSASSVACLKSPSHSVVTAALDFFCAQGDASRCPCHKCLHATIEQFAAEGFTHIERHCPRCRMTRMRPIGCFLREQGDVTDVKRKLGVAPSLTGRPLNLPAPQHEPAAGLSLFRAALCGVRWSTALG